MRSPTSKQAFRLETNFSKFIPYSQVIKQLRAENARLRKEKAELLEELANIKIGTRRQINSILTILDGTLYRKD